VGSCGGANDPLAERRALYHHLLFDRLMEGAMAKGQMRVPKEKKKPKADKDKPKQMSAYKQAQMAGSSSMPLATGKKA
jgi:hypothetical protein